MNIEIKLFDNIDSYNKKIFNETSVEVDEEYSKKDCKSVKIISETLKVVNEILNNQFNIGRECALLVTKGPIPFRELNLMSYMYRVVVYDNKERLGSIYIFPAYRIDEELMS